MIVLTITTRPYMVSSFSVCILKFYTLSRDKGTITLTEARISGGLIDGHVISDNTLTHNWVAKSEN